MKKFEHALLPFTRGPGNWPFARTALEKRPLEVGKSKQSR